MNFSRLLRYNVFGSRSRFIRSGRSIDVTRPANVFLIPRLLRSVSPCAMSLDRFPSSGIVSTVCRTKLVTRGSKRSDKFEVLINNRPVRAESAAPNYNDNAINSPHRPSHYYLHYESDTFYRLHS